MQVVLFYLNFKIKAIETKETTVERQEDFKIYKHMWERTSQE